MRRRRSISQLVASYLMAGALVISGAVLPEPLKAGLSEVALVVP